MIDDALIQNIAISALVAASVQVALRAGVFSLAGIGCYGIGSYTAAILVLHSVPTALAMIAGVALAAAVGYVLALILVRLRALYLAMATVAFNLILGVIATNGGSLTGGANGLYAIPVELSTSTMLLICAVVAVLLIGLESNAIGRANVAGREDEELAQSLAIDVARQRRLIFVVSGALGGLAGASRALLFSAIGPTDAGFQLIVLTLTMVIIGGYGSWVGAFVGAALITWLPIKLQVFGDWWNVIYGGGMLLAAVYVPSGLWGVLRRIARTAKGRDRRGRRRPAGGGQPARGTA